MPDITCCHGKYCQIKEKCYRYTATPNAFWQSYFLISPYKDEKCEYFLEYKNEDKKN